MLTRKKYSWDLSPGTVAWGLWLRSTLVCAWATERAGPVSRVRIIGETPNLERNFRKQTNGYGNGVDLSLAQEERWV